MERLVYQLVATKWAATVGASFTKFHKESNTSKYFADTKSTILGCGENEFLLIQKPVNWGQF